MFLKLCFWRGVIEKLKVAQLVKKFLHHLPTAKVHHPIRKSSLLYFTLSQSIPSNPTPLRAV
jgi:hypothetical protein